MLEVKQEAVEEAVQVRALSQRVSVLGAPLLDLGASIEAGKVCEHCYSLHLTVAALPPPLLPSLLPPPDLCSAAAGHQA